LENTTNKWVDEMKGVLETLNQGVIINDDRKRIIFANRLFLKMIGIPAEELLGITITDLYSPDDAALLEKQIARRRVEGHAQYEFYLPQRSSKSKILMATYSP
jgi:PAS domain S-box-containing protein